MSSFDIEEPIYILEANGMRFLPDLRPGKEQDFVCRVDELSTCLAAR